MLLFDHNRQRIATPTVGRSRQYSHHFGGSPEDYGFSVAGDYPLQVVFVFDGHDPLCPIPVQRRWIPLCYGFQFEGGHTTYRLHRNRIEILWPQKPEVASDFPYPNYPPAFRQQRLILRRSVYNPGDAEDALMCSAFFGLGHVRTRVLKAVATRIDEFGLWDDVDLDGLSRIEFLRKESWWFPLPQGRPSSKCQYVECSHYGTDGAMQIIGFHAGYPDPHEEVMWGQGVEMVCLIFQMCRTCSTFVVSNQCT